MEALTNMLYIFFLVLVLSVGIFNWLYANEVRKVKEHVGIVFPSFVEKLIGINRFLPLVVGTFILLLLFMTLYTTFR